MSATATSAAAVAISASAQAEADRAHRAACEAMMPSYQHATATVEQMRAYAECVDKLNPSELAPDVAFVLKICIVLVFAGAVVGSFDRAFSDGIVGRIMGAVFGAAMTAAGLLIIGLILMAFRFLAS